MVVAWARGMMKSMNNGPGLGGRDMIWHAMIGCGLSEERDMDMCDCGCMKSMSNAPGNGSLALATATQMIRGIFPPFRPPFAMANSCGSRRAVNCSSVGKKGRRLGSVRSPSTGKLTKRRRKHRRHSTRKKLHDCMLLKRLLRS